MAGFFCLGGRDQPSRNKQEENQEQNNQRNLFLYRTDQEICSKGFEIWPQYHQNLSNYVSFGSSSRRNLNNATNNSSSEDVVSDHELPGPRLGFTVMRPGGPGGGGGGGGGMNCQDCGNQAKKDCVHLRCRTCCKSRGFQCHTHVKSTWVPAAKRRERQQQLLTLQNQQQQLQHQNQQQQQQDQQFRVDNSKRHRENNQGSASLVCTTTRLPTTTSGLELGAFPAEVNSPAHFRCVRVTAMDDQDEHYAYQTAVNIGGHVFKGILYDRGPDQAHYTGSGGESSSGRGEDHGGAAQQLNLITAATATRTAAVTTAGAGNPSMSLVDPSVSLVYPTPLNTFMAGTQFFPPPRS